ncbi:MAG: hypothetical protein Q4F72_05545, partial [Desulfovibrionaceae bacterium]|nr:hypothetical protein [Desulfovibrionaceae bacterium]
MKTKKAFSIKTDWLPNQSSRIGDEPNEDMIANLTIDLLGSKLTRNFDLDDREIRDSVALAPYPLTLWLVGYWWRLRWESTPWQPSYGWFKSHTLSSA